MSSEGMSTKEGSKLERKNKISLKIIWDNHNAMEAKTENKLRYSTTVTTVKPYITALYTCITLCITLTELVPYIYC